MKYLFALLILAISSTIYSQTPPIEAGVSQELAKWRAAHYSDVRYKLNLTLEKMSPVLKGTMEIRVRVNKPSRGGPSANVVQVDGIPVPGATVLPLPISDVPIILDWRKIKGFEDRSTVSNVFVNGKAVTVSTAPPAHTNGSDLWVDEHLVFRDGVVAGENVIKLDFTSPILTSGSAITRYVDKEDGAEYIYSLFVPSDASTAFPVFDQPDLKAKFEVSMTAPAEWTFVTNTATYSLLDIRTGFETKPISTYVFAFAAGPFERVSVPPALAGGTMSDANQPAVKSETSPPANAGGTDPTNTRNVKLEINEAYKNWAKSVPPALAGGKMPDANQPAVKSETSPPADAGGTDMTADLATSIYVRKSQAEKFKPHAAEVFRLNREAIKYFEEYFDYKFPFPKYDLVLIPEFPFGGMEHAGATFLRESAIIFPTEPTKNDHISRALLIFHEAAHQWFGDTVTMRWFDDLWLKEGFANFAAYKAMEKIMPEANAWKVFYERVKQAAYRTDSTKGTTPIYQEIKNLSAAKSAYGNIVYNKAPAFLRQAEFYLGEDKFQTAIRAFLKKHEFKNAGWEDLVKEFEAASGQDLKRWASNWVTQPGLPKYRTTRTNIRPNFVEVVITPVDALNRGNSWVQKSRAYYVDNSPHPINSPLINFEEEGSAMKPFRLSEYVSHGTLEWKIFFPNYQDYSYGIFLLDDKSRDYVLKNIQNEKDPFLRSMMWGSLWDSVREGELDPREYVELVVRVLGKSDGFSRSSSGDGTGLVPGVTLTETLTEDESTIATLLGRTSTALNYYIDTMQKPDREGGRNGQGESYALANARASASVGNLPVRVENMLIERMQNADTLGQRITYYRAFLNVAASENARVVLKDILNLKFEIKDLKLKTKDKFDIATKLLILGDADAAKLLAELEKTETSDEAKRYAYAAKAGIATAENKAKYWNDFVNNKEISESWIEAAFGPFNSIRHNELTLSYLQKALQELPNHKRSRKIFFVNGWLGAFIGGQRSEEALAIVNKFLADNPDLDKDLRLKILENVDVIERAVKIRAKYSRN